MKVTAYGALALACFACANVAAAKDREPLGNIDLYYVADSKLEVEDSSGNSGSISGHGFGVKGSGALNPNLFFDAQYEKDTHSNSNGDLDLDDLRVGLGIRAPGNPFFARAEFVSLKLSAAAGGLSASSTESGFGVHVGGIAHLDNFSLNAEVGYLSVGDAGNGFEYTAGGAFDLTRDWAVFADYRATELKKNGDTIRPKDVRVGVRFNFR